MEIITVWEVRGDFGNMGYPGDGRTIAIFSSKEQAEEHKVGCGSLDCGGDAIVVERLATPSGKPNQYFLLEKGEYELNVMGWSAAKDYHTPDEVRELVLVSCQRRVETIKILRQVLHVNLRTAMDIVDNLPYTFKGLSTQAREEYARVLRKADCGVKSVFTDGAN